MSSRAQRFAERLAKLEVERAPTLPVSVHVVRPILILSPSGKRRVIGRLERYVPESLRPPRRGLPREE